MKFLRFAFKYLIYLFKAQSRHGLHSPFVYKLLDEVILNKNQYYSYEEIESLRAQLLMSDKIITVTDFGAGSHLTPQKKRKVREIAKHSAKPAKYGKLLFRLVEFFKPQNMLELGTSLGISTLYQAKANSDGNFITLEGCPEVAAIAESNFKKLNSNNIKLICGNFSETLPQAIEVLPKLEYVFFDGNHQKEATLDYFNKCLKKSQNESIFIFDDIHWSRGMEEAWEEIKKHHAVTVTIDLFFVGLVFFRKEQVKQDFILRF
jgi:predicted O-methyltransferase YrrM